MKFFHVCKNFKLTCLIILDEAFFIIITYLITYVLILEGLLKNFLYSVYVNIVQTNPNNNPYNNTNCVTKINKSSFVSAAVNYSAVIGLAFIFLSNYMDFGDKTVISACITFTDRKSLFTNKTADESSMGEIYTEVLRQLRLSYPDLPNPDRMITSPQVYKNNNKWINIDTAYVTTSENQHLPFESNLYPNLYNCGCQNGKSNYHFTSLESAITNSVYLFNKIEPNAKYKRNVKTYAQITNYIHVVILILILGIAIYIYKNNINKLN